jgi:signal transduction histidine kinase
MGAYQPVPLATMIAVWTVAGRLPRRIGWATGISAALLLLTVGVVARPLDLLATDLVMFQLVIIATAFGAQVTARRDRAERVERDKQDAVRRHVTDERLRIARDLHDTLAHHLTVVNAQAGVANYLLRTNPDAAVTALTGITDHTRHALDELRATIGLLRYDTPDTTGDPESSPTPPIGQLRPVPGLDQLSELVASSRTAGIDVVVTTAGDPRPLPTSVGTAAYRIVQEALTNTARHAPGATAEVTLTWSTAHLQVDIHNSAPPGGHPAEPAPGTGHGLIGMRERAHACGGDVATEHLPDGGYLVHATLPAPAASPLPGTVTS